jgi:hypothetical protein
MTGQREISRGQASARLKIRHDGPFIGHTEDYITCSTYIPIHTMKTGQKLLAYKLMGKTSL